MSRIHQNIFIDFIHRAAGSASYLKTTTKLVCFTRTLFARLHLVRFLNFIFPVPPGRAELFVKTISIGPRTGKTRTLSFTLRAKTPPNDNRRAKGPISASMISVPTANSFIHVAHVGLTTSGTIEASKGVDPSWTAVLGGYGVQDQTLSSRSQKFSDKRVDRVGGEGHWLVGQSSRRGVGAKEIFGGSEQEGVSTNPSLQGRRRLPTPSFTMF